MLYFQQNCFLRVLGRPANTETQPGGPEFSSLSGTTFLTFPAWDILP